jgi:hypothetical protein
LSEAIHHICRVPAWPAASSTRPVAIRVAVKPQHGRRLFFSILARPSGDRRISSPREKSTGGATRVVVLTWIQRPIGWTGV